MFSNFSEYRAVYQIMSKYLVMPERLQITIWRMYVVCWVSKGTRAQAHAHALAHAFTRAHAQECVILLFTATMVSWTRLSVTLHVHCLSSYKLLHWCTATHYRPWTAHWKLTSLSALRNFLRKRSGLKYRLSNRYLSCLFITAIFWFRSYVIRSVIATCACRHLVVPQTRGFSYFHRITILVWSSCRLFCN